MGNPSIFIPLNQRYLRYQLLLISYYTLTILFIKIYFSKQ